MRRLPAILASGAAAVSLGALLPTPDATAATSDGVIRVSTATSPVTDSTGHVWAARTGFIGGATDVNVPSWVGIANTSDDQLYRTGIYALSGFHRSVANGSYRVTVKMSENYFDAAGKRVFSIAAEGRTIASGIDLYKLRGKHSAYDVTADVTVTDGAVDLKFTASVNYALVSAISIAPLTATQSASTSPISSGTVPGSGNTGVPAGTSLKQHYGDLTITTPGTVIDGMDIHGFVNVKASDVTIKRSIVRGGYASYDTGLVTDYGYPRLVVQDTELVPEHPSVWIDAIKGNNFTALRINAHGTVDTAKVHGDNVRIQDSWLHDTHYYYSDPNQGGKPSHNDGVQVLGGSNISIVNNTITGSSNTAIMVTQDYARVSGLTITRNHLDGGVCTVNMNNKKLSSMSGITLTYNKFGRHLTAPNCPVITTYATYYTAAGNVWADTGAAVPLKRQG